MSLPRSDRRPRALLVPALLLSAVLAPTPAPAHETYALVFSGGFDAANNHTRYYDATLRMWTILTDTLKFDVDKVYVLFADGTDPGLDRTDGEEIDKDPANQVSSDWSAITAAGGIIRTATTVSLENTMNEIAGRITADDSFYFWAFNHGANPAVKKCPNTKAPNDDGTIPANAVDTDVCENPIPGANPTDVQLVTWQGTITDANFAGLAGLVSAKDPKAEAYVFAECFSEGMADNLFPAPRRFAAWSAAAGECSLGKGWADAWANALEGGFRSTFDLGLTAMLTDPFGGGPGMNKETPGFEGFDFDIITNDPVTAPPAAGLMVLGTAALLGLGSLRRR